VTRAVEERAGMQCAEQLAPSARCCAMKSAARMGQMGQSAEERDRDLLCFQKINDPLFFTSKKISDPLSFTSKKK